MSKKNDQKLCWNCDGSIGLELDVCPYCGVNLEAPFKSPWDSSPPSEPSFPKAIAKEEAPPEELSSNSSPFGVLLLVPGVMLLLFAFALLFFSRGGVLTLSWNKSSALFYLLLSAPLLFFGFRGLNK